MAGERNVFHAQASKLRGTGLEPDFADRGVHYLALLANLGKLWPHRGIEVATHILVREVYRHARTALP